MIGDGEGDRGGRWRWKRYENGEEDSDGEGDGDTEGEGEGGIGRQIWRFIFPLNLLYHFLKYIFWIWLRFVLFLLGSCTVIQILVRLMNFSGHIFSIVKSKKNFGTIFSLKSNPYHLGKVYNFLCRIWNFIRTSLKFTCGY